MHPQSKLHATDQTSPTIIPGKLMKTTLELLFFPALLSGAAAFPIQDHGDPYNPISPPPTGPVPEDFNWICGPCEAKIPGEFESYGPILAPSACDCSIGMSIGFGPEPDGECSWQAQGFDIGNGTPWECSSDVGCDFIASGSFSCSGDACYPVHLEGWSNYDTSLDPGDGYSEAGPADSSVVSANPNSTTAPSNSFGPFDVSVACGTTKVPHIVAPDGSVLQYMMSCTACPDLAITINDNQ